MTAGQPDVAFDEDVDVIKKVAQKMAADAKNLKEGNPVAQPTTAPPTAKVATVAAPPTAPVLTPEQISMAKYNAEKAKMAEVHQQLIDLSHGDKCGEIIRNFGMSQLILHVGETIDRTNGLVLLRAIKSQAHSKNRERCSVEKEKVVEIMATVEHIVTHLYEVWGLMEDGSIGLTACYAPEIVFCVLSLNSGLDMPPDLEDEED